MKKYLILAILTFLSLGLIANIKSIEEFTAFRSTEAMITRENIEESVVCAGSITKITANGVFATIYVDENFASKVQRNQSVVLTANALEDMKFQGHIYELSDEAKMVKIGSVSQIMVEATVKLEDATQREFLRVGYTIRAEILVHTKENALVVPYEALVLQENQYFVYKLIENWAVKTPITVLEESAEGAVIEEGVLKSGDYVVSEIETIAKDKKFLRYSSNWETEKIG